MMNYYRVKKELFFNGEKIGEQYGYTMKEKDCSDVSLYCGKELLQCITDFGRLPNDFQEIASWEKRIIHRGYVIYGWGMNFGGIRRVLHEEDKIVCKIKYEERIPSIQEVMKYPNGAKAIQWLKDRGITACPMINPQ
jgi:hypothetical protein